MARFGSPSSRGQATMLKPARCSLPAETAHQSSMQRSATSFANSRYFRPVRPKETSIHKWDQEFESAFLPAESLLRT
jgi:hypothetical protein